MRRDRQRLNDLLEALDWIGRAITGRTEAEFLADETLCYAVAQKLTIIGEAVARLSPEITSRHNSVPWPDIVGLRNILVHEYVSPDLDRAVAALRELEPVRRFLSIVSEIERTDGTCD